MLRVDVPLVPWRFKYECALSQDSSKLVATQGDPGLLDEFFMGKWDMMLPSNVPAAYVCCTRFTFGMLSMCTGQVFQPLSLPSQTI